MHVDDVEGIVCERERMDIGYLEVDVGEVVRGGQGARVVEWLWGVFYPGDVAGWDATGKVDCDAAGSAADVKDLAGGFEMWDEVGGGVGYRAPAVGLNDGGGVVGGVGAHDDNI